MYAQGRTRTGTVLLPRDFKSLASTYFATRASEIMFEYYMNKGVYGICEWNSMLPALDAIEYFRRCPDSNRGIMVLQTIALPLGYTAR